jgi:nucleoside-diphosphate-sugar epimerase
MFRAIEYWDVPSLYISTCSLYERRRDAACDEESPLREKLCSPYLRAKLDGERLFGGRSDVAIMRLSAPLGPGLRTGTVVPAFIMAARNRGTLTVWGDGAREQDFIDTRDTASLIAAWVSSPRFGMFNMAKGEPTTMLELAHAIIDVIGSGSLVQENREDPNAGIRARYDVGKARSSFRWKPRFTLRQSIAAISGLKF